MYLSFYRLKRNPFQISTNPDFLWLGEKHREALATLRYGILDNKGFLLLTGDVGTGKTTLINALVNSLEEDVLAVSVADPGLDKLDLYYYIAAIFGMNQEFATKGQFLVLFSRFLHQAYDQGKKVLLIIDEAQRLSQELLEEIRLLSNIERPDSKLINIFFVGQNEFNGILLRQENRALRQRITVSYDIAPLSVAETGEYLRHRLKVAGCELALFSPGAVQEIHAFTNGFPRLINVLADRTLLTGFVEEAREIGPKIVIECARELRIPTPKSRPRPVEEVAVAAPQPAGPAPTPATALRQGDQEAPAGSAAAVGGGEEGPREPAVTDDRKPEVLTMAQVAAASRPQPMEVPKTASEPGEKKQQRGLPWGVLFLIVLLGGGGYAAWHYPRQVEQYWQSGVSWVNALVREPHNHRPRQAATGPGVVQPPGDPGRNASGQQQKAGPVRDKKTATPGQPRPADKPSPPVSTKVAGAGTAGTVAQTVQAAPALLGEKAVPAMLQQQEEPGGPAPKATTRLIRQPQPQHDPAKPKQATMTDAELDPIFLDQILTVRFGHDSNALTGQGARMLNKLSLHLHAFPYTEVIIRGYTDATGPEHYNRRLSAFRANLVKGYLMGRGVAPQTIRTMGMGGADPIAPNDTREGRERNRRVEIEVRR